MNSHLSIMRRQKHSSLLRIHQCKSVSIPCKKHFRFVQSLVHPSSHIVEQLKQTKVKCHVTNQYQQHVSDRMFKRVNLGQRSRQVDLFEGYNGSASMEGGETNQLVLKVKTSGSGQRSRQSNLGHLRPKFETGWPRPMDKIGQPEPKVETGGPRPKVAIGQLGFKVKTGQQGSKSKWVDMC